ncbi:sialidase family protein, partial [Planctomycetota bacterium]
MIKENKIKKAILVVALVLFTSLGCDQSDKERLRTGQIKPVKGVAYIYATFEMGPVNPIPRGSSKDPADSEDEKTPFDMGPVDPTPGAATESAKHEPLVTTVPKYPQIVSVGQKKGDVFVPAVKFGLGDDNRAVDAKMCPWATDGSINYFGPYMRPNTAYDFKIKLDMDKNKMTIHVSGRGDDDWFLLAENVRLINPVKSINHVEIRDDYPASKIGDIKVRSSKWGVGEQIRPHRLAKTDRVVKSGAGFEFGSMQSTWRKPGKHVTIFREEGSHFGFPDVAQVGPDHLICVWQNSSHTGSSDGRGGSISHSYDLGQTWSAPVSTPEYIIHCPRIQKLNDGTLLLHSDAHGEGPWGNWDVIFYDSNDGGHTWTNPRWLNTVEAGDSNCMVPGHVYEANDGSWLIVGSEYGSGINERLKFFRSPDRGVTWQFVTQLLLE